EHLPLSGVRGRLGPVLQLVRRQAVPLRADERVPVLQPGTEPEVLVEDDAAHGGSPSSSSSSSSQSLSHASTTLSDTTNGRANPDRSGPVSTSWRRWEPLLISVRLFESATISFTPSTSSICIPSSATYEQTPFSCPVTWSPNSRARSKTIVSGWSWYS